MARVGKHVFVDSGVADHDGVRQCSACPLPEPNEIHELPELSDEQRQYDQRRTGDRD